MEKPKPLKLQMRGFDSHLVHQRIIMKHDYKVDIAMTANIDSDVAMNMIVEVVEKQTGKKVSKITPTYEGGDLNGFHVTFDPNSNTIKAFKPSKEFIVNHFGAEE